MSTELRRSKRKAATEPDDEPAPATKKVLKVAAKAKKTATDTSSSKNNDKFKSDRTIKLDDFASQEIETHEGVKTTLKAMVEGSKSGVAIFTYPKASTPGCKSPLFIPPAVLDLSCLAISDILKLWEHTQY